MIWQDTFISLIGGVAVILSIHNNKPNQQCRQVTTHHQSSFYPNILLILSLTHFNHLQKLICVLTATTLLFFFSLSSALKVINQESPTLRTVLSVSLFWGGWCVIVGWLRFETGGTNMCSRQQLWQWLTLWNLCG